MDPPCPSADSHEGVTPQKPHQLWPSPLPTCRPVLPALFHHPCQALGLGSAHSPLTLPVRLWRQAWALLEPASHTHFTHTFHSSTHTQHPSFHSHTLTPQHPPCVHTHPLSLPYTLAHPSMFPQTKHFPHIHEHIRTQNSLHVAQTTPITTTNTPPHHAHTSTSTLLPPPQLPAGRIFTERLRGCCGGHPGPPSPHQPRS